MPAKVDGEKNEQLTRVGYKWRAVAQKIYLLNGTASRLLSFQLAAEHTHTEAGIRFSSTRIYGMIAITKTITHRPNASMYACHFNELTNLIVEKWLSLSAHSARAHTHKHKLQTILINWTIAAKPRNKSRELFCFEHSKCVHENYKQHPTNKHLNWWLTANILTRAN